MSDEAGGEPQNKSKLMLYTVIGCVVGLVVAVTVWLVIALPELQKRSGPPPVKEKTKEEIALVKEQKAKEAEKSATWQNFHCNLLHYYYDGPEIDLPLSELIGLTSDADENAVRERCRELLPAVRLMGGWPNDRRAQDNFVVCDGFQFALKNAGGLTIRPLTKDLQNNDVTYGVPGKWLKKQKLVDGHTLKVGNFLPLATQADDRCIIVSVGRTGRKRTIPGTIARTP